MISEPICCFFRVVARANIIIVRTAASVTAEAGKGVGCHHGVAEFFDGSMKEVMPGVRNGSNQPKCLMSRYELCCESFVKR